MRMIANGPRTTDHGRRGFTLTELLVVIFIIITLLGILLPAIQVTRIRAQVAQATNDLSQLSQGIDNFKSTYHVSFVPNYFWLKSTYNTGAGNPRAADEAAMLGYLRQVWGRIQDQNGGNAATLFDTSLGWAFSGNPFNPGTPAFVTVTPGFNPPLNQAPTGPGQSPRFIELTGDQCLVFFLGGYAAVAQSNAQNPQRFAEFGLGFSTSATDPFRADWNPNIGQAHKERGGVFMEFPKNRLKSRDRTGAEHDARVPAHDGNDYPVFLDPWNQPFIYFTAINSNDYNSSILNATGWCLDKSQSGPPYPPLVSAFQENSPTLKFVNANTFQIISAGPDAYQPNRQTPAKKGGGIGPGGVWVPGQGNYAPGTPGADDLANFYSKQLGVP